MVSPGTAIDSGEKANTEEYLVLGLEKMGKKHYSAMGGLKRGEILEIGGGISSYVLLNM